MSEGKPFQPDMPHREMQQTGLDTERSTHAGMQGQSKSSHKYLLLQVWCGLLTVTMVVMAAHLATIKSKSSEDVSRLRLENPIAPTTAVPFPTQMKSVGSPLSHIQLIKILGNDSWEVTPEYKDCSLLLRNESIYCMEESLYFIYAQVTFTKQQSNQTKYVGLYRNPRPGKRRRKLVEGIFPNTTEGTVWVANIVKLQKDDSVSLDITHDCLKENTFWGAYQLQN